VQSKNFRIWYQECYPLVWIFTRSILPVNACYAPCYAIVNPKSIDELEVENIDNPSVLIVVHLNYENRSE